MCACELWCCGCACRSVPYLLALFCAGGSKNGVPALLYAGGSKNDVSLSDGSAQVYSKNGLTLPAASVTLPPPANVRHPGEGQGGRILRILAAVLQLYYVVVHN